MHFDHRFHRCDCQNNKNEFKFRFSWSALTVFIVSAPVPFRVAPEGEGVHGYAEERGDDVCRK